MSKKSLSAIFAVILLSVSGPLAAQDGIATLRKGAPLSEEPTAPTMPKVSNQDLRRTRSYPEQPPTIPHAIRDYRVDLNSNKCLSCHSRKATEETQAPMVSITHFMDRDGQSLAAVSSRRYFCLQCHVPQFEARPLVENEFVDIDTLLEQ
jgi:cytochrome c-type protein NapB